ncbi:hypothetical protein DdX_20876 [Ditylenchus destructor]|uniref:Uncharacterized protein n=1 Tax=Ditylenchus destructor TaxID=166010 RepID=A0AAD4MGF8_9BILA|nr:hypothetical protein DdX_20876 [Ditylenchus destructor]
MDPSVKFLVDLHLGNERKITLRESTTVGQLKIDYSATHIPSNIDNSVLVLEGKDGKRKYEYKLGDKEKVIVTSMADGDVLKFVTQKDSHSKAKLQQIKDKVVGVIKEVVKKMAKTVEKFFQLPPFRAKKSTNSQDTHLNP